MKGLGEILANRLGLTREKEMEHWEIYGRGSCVVLILSVAVVLVATF